MVSRLLERDWPSSPAYLLLLSKFSNGDSLARYRNDVNWETVLETNPLSIIEQFIAEGLLELAGLPEFLDYKFKVPELKSLLKSKGLKLSGNKQNLIHRLINNDTEAMLQYTKGSDIYQCSNAGLRLVENYQAAEKEKRNITENKVYELLKRQDFSDAVLVVAKYEASQVFSRGVGIDWKNYDGASMVDALKAIFNSTPAILNNIEENQLNQLRLATGMMRLWGASTAQRWMPEGIDKATLDAWNVASRMLDFHAIHLSRMRMFKDAGVRNVEVSGIADNMQCPECKKIDGKLYKLEDAPELPYANCTCEMGCRCMLIAEDKFWKPA